MNFRLIEGGRSQPLLSLDSVRGAKTLAEAIEKTASKGAGSEDLDAMMIWLNNPDNVNSLTADRWRKTQNFFPGTTVGTGPEEMALCLGWFGVMGFQITGAYLDNKWEPNFRIVYR